MSSWWSKTHVEADVRPADHVSRPPVDRDDGTTWRTTLTLKPEP